MAGNVFRSCLGEMKEVDRLIVARATRHGDHIHRDQLKALGLGRGAIEQRLRTGFLIAAFPSVYAVGRIPTNPRDRAKGALLAVHPQAALTGRSAASLHGTLKDWRFPLEVTSPVRRRPSGLIVRHRPTLTRRDIAVRFGVRVTNGALTALDTAPRMSPLELGWAIDRMRLDGWLRLDQIDTLLDRYPRHPGSATMRETLLILHDEPVRSPWELEWPPYAAKHGLPPYAMNVRIGPNGHRVDVLFLPDLLVVEMDGWETHQTRAAFEADRDRDADVLDALNIATVRETHRRFHAQPDREAARLHRIVAQQRALKRAA